ncbi:hypothetical protein [Kribbella antiqua]|uniref:hypothetical protein n=1 Tax=Kribbella antiqua TaxID=2512217 RepID=UPI0013053B1D|nr:hypothetical protein [Kribbella antiqua]
MSKAERRRLLEANLAATRFFRRELLRADRGWAARYLEARGARRVLTPESRWALGYAPDSWSRLVDHLRSRGFEFQTLELAGLAMRTAEGQIVDRFRDQLMLMSRDEGLDPVGFVGFRDGARPFYTTTAVTPVHRRSKVLLGVDEQLDLLSGGAIPVLVDDPMDAVAVEKVSRLSLIGGSGSHCVVRCCRRRRRECSVVIPPLRQ